VHLLGCDRRACRTTDALEGAEALDAPSYFANGIVVPSDRDCANAQSRLQVTIERVADERTVETLMIEP
jgi:hypothetical protein